MSFGEFINRAKDLVSGHPDQAQQAFDRVEQVINDRTGNKYADQLAKGEGMLQDRLGIPHSQQGGQAAGQQAGRGDGQDDTDLTRTGTSSPSDDEMQGGSEGAVNPGQSPGPSTN